MSENNISEPEVIDGNMSEHDKNVPQFTNRTAYQSLTRKYFPILSQLQDVQSFRLLKSDVLSSAQITVLKYALSAKKLEKASFLQLCQGFEILNKAERLDTGQTTENIGNMVFGKVRVEHFDGNNKE